MAMVEQLFWLDGCWHLHMADWQLPIAEHFDALYTRLTIEFELHDDTGAVVDVGADVVTF